MDILFAIVIIVCVAMVCGTYLYGEHISRRSFDSGLKALYSHNYPEYMYKETTTYVPTDENDEQPNELVGDDVKPKKKRKYYTKKKKNGES